MIAKNIFILLLTVTAVSLVRTEDDEFFDLEFPGEVFSPEGNSTIHYLGNYAQYQAAVGNANEYLDQVIANALTTFKNENIDPLTIPDVSETFQKKVLFIKLSGGFKASNIQLKGLTTLHRADDSTLDLQRDFIKLRATLAVNNMAVGANAKVWLYKPSISWYMTASIQYLKATVELQIPNKPGVKASATEFTINEVGSIKITFKELGPLNWILNQASKLFENKLKDVLRYKIKDSIHEAINDAMAKIPNFQLP